MENNNSDTLLVFQATGIKEWGIGQASAAGRRIELSWERKQKIRNDFNIINVVQCLPGNNGDRDLEPNIISIYSCLNRLEHIQKEKNYKRIILFGQIAQNVGDNLIYKLGIKVDVIIL